MTSYRPALNKGASSVFAAHGMTLNDANTRSRERLRILDRPFWSCHVPEKSTNRSCIASAFLAF
jgi:hypothetical protein